MSNKLLQLTGSCQIRASGESGKTPLVSIVGYSGGLMTVDGWGAIVINLAGLSMPGQVPILSDHDATLKGIVGHGAPSIEAGQLLVNGQLSKGGQAAQQIIELSKSGLVFQASVGVEPTESQRIEPGKTVTVNGKNISTKSGFTLVKSGKLREISIVSIGADAETSVSIAAKNQQKGNEHMSTENIFTGQAKVDFDAYDGHVVSPAMTAQLQANFSGGTPDPAIEAQRMQLIESWSFKPDRNASDSIREQAAILKAKAISGEISLDQLRAGGLELLRAGYPKAPAVYGSRMDTNDRVIEAALSLQSGLPSPEKHYDEKTLEVASSREFQGYGLQRLLVAAAVAAGYPSRPGEGIHGGNLREVLSYALPSVRAGGVSTLSVSNMLSNVANKNLLDGFNSIPQKWREVAAVRSVRDFKEATAYRLTADLEYEELPPGGEIKHGTLGEESYTMKANTYAKMLTLTRTDIINDDLGAFNDLRTRLGMGAAQKLNSLFWMRWVNNSAFFTSARGNYIEGAGTVLSEAGLNTAVKLFREMQGPDGNALDLEPAILLVPTDLEATARKWYASTEIRDTTASTKTPVANIYEKMFRPVSVSQLGSSSYTGYSATAWYLLADPAILATAAMCFLNGQQSPTIESADADFNTLGVSFRGYHDFGVSFADYRAGVKSKGSV